MAWRRLKDTFPFDGHHILLPYGLDYCSGYVLMTRGEVLRYAVAFALRRAQARVRPQGGLTKDERYAVADHVVSQLKERGDPWGLSEEARPKVARPPRDEEVRVRTGASAPEPIEGRPRLHFISSYANSAEQPRTNFCGGRSIVA
jgi:hypothetical protein